MLNRLVILRQRKYSTQIIRRVKPRNREGKLTYGVDLLRTEIRKLSNITILYIGAIILNRCECYAEQSTKETCRPPQQIKFQAVKLNKEL